MFIEIFYGGQCLDGISPIGVFFNEVILMDIVFILYITNNLFQDILNGDNTGDIGILIVYNRNVVTLFPEVLQQYIHRLALRDGCIAPDVVPNIETGIVPVQRQRQ